MNRFVLGWSLVVLVSAGCASRSNQDHVRFVGPPAVAPPVGDVTPGLIEKEPDTCGAARVQGFVGKSSGMIRTVRIDGAVRMIGPGELVSQEYNAHRVNVYTDADGVIQQINCG